MKCEVVRNLLSLYMDKELNDAEKVEIEKHLVKCSDCRQEYELLVEIASECGIMEEAELPDGFKEELHHKLIREKSLKRNNILNHIKRVNWKVASALVAAFIVVAIGIGSNLSNMMANSEAKNDMAMGNRSGVNYFGSESGASSGFAAQGAQNGVMMDKVSENAAPREALNSMATTEDIAVAAQSKAKPSINEGSNLGKEVKVGRKVIKSGSMSLEISDFDLKIEEIAKIVQNYGGYIENSTVDNVTYSMENDKKTRKQGNIAIRIPSDKFEEVFEKIKAMGNATTQNINGSDITSQYIETDTRVASLRIQEKSLQELMAKANSVDDILRIETELARVRTDIELMTGDLKRWDDLVAMSTLNISLIEVTKEDLKQVSIDNVWGRAYNGFIKAINNIIGASEKLVVFMVTAIPYIIIIGIITALTLYFLKRRRGKKNER